MKKLFSGKTLFITGGILVIIVIGIIIVAVQIGKAYKSRINNITPTDKFEAYKLVKKRNVKKITYQRSATDTSCTEISPDGIVRIYSICGQELDTAARSTRYLDLQQLLMYSSEIDLQKLANNAKKGIKITLETDGGTETYYLAVDDPKEPSIGDYIEDLINNIENEIANPSPSTSVNPQASSFSTAYPSAQPSAPSYATPNPSASGISPNLIPFTCDFTSNGSKRPYNVSNIICSTNPSPGL